MYSDPDDRKDRFLDAVERYVARDHWEPVASQAAIQAAVMAGLTLLLGMPALAALAIVHFMSLVTATIYGLHALHLAESGHGDGAVVIARRSLAALLLSGIAMLLMPLAV
ncbi:hypothetical protein DEW08_09835 [Azospirillum thermophilum]|uniref:Uncharacterized protein n=1 Tax=Azospirillum thermophilum TaxID=2202148 RepID=A0A2S2CQ42_9PROT|nr:hypothetical protein DEW08_09835 [Azospirillum thermophilum]